MPGIPEAATIVRSGACSFVTSMSFRDADNTETAHLLLIVDEPPDAPDCAEPTRLIVEELGELYAPESYSQADPLPHRGR